MGLIGSLSVKLSATSKGFDAAVDGAQKKLATFGAKVNTPFNMLVKGYNAIGDGVQNVLGPLQKTLSGIPLIGSALSGLVGGGGGFINMFKETAKEITETQKQANTLGISFASMAGIQRFAGDSAESLQRGMLKLGAKVGEVRAGNSDASKSFQRLGFDVKAISGMNLEQAFAMVANKVRDTSNPADRAAIALELFGKQGAALLPILIKGGDALESWKQKVIAAGLAPSKDNIEEFRLLGIHLKEAELRWDALKVKLTANFGLPLLEKIQELLNYLSDAPEKNLNPSKKDFDAAKMTPTDLKRAFGDTLGNKVGEILQAQKKPEFTESQLAESNKQFAIGQGIEKLESEISKEIAAMSQTTDQLKRLELAAKGATDAQLADVDALMQAKKVTQAIADGFKMMDEKIKEAGKQGEEMQKKFTTPLEAAKEQINHINGLFQGGFINETTRNRALSGVADDIVKAGGNNLPTLMQSGSREAVSEVNKTLYGNSSNNVMVNMLKAIQDGTQSDKQREQIQRDIANKVNDIQPLLPGKVK
jgi:hypothetical protein